MSDSVINYYVNMGRWATSVIGPFWTFEEADRYIEGTDWRGARPTVVTVAPPTPKEYTVAFGHKNDDEPTIFVKVKKASNHDNAVNIARTILHDPSGPNWMFYEFPAITSVDSE